MTDPEYTIYEDYGGCKLYVREIDIGNSLGREIRGVLYKDGLRSNNYSCSLDIWYHVWYNREKIIDPAKIKI